MPAHRFTRAQLSHEITTGEYNAMSPVDKAAFDTELFALWMGEYDRQTTADLSRDDDMVGSYRRSDLGE